MTVPATAWKPGESGNPNGMRASKLCYDALRLAALRIIDGDPEGRTYLAKTAHAVVVKASEGDMDAISMLFDRLDGKPTQAVQHETGDGQPLLSFLVQIAEPEPAPKVIEAQPEPETDDNPDASKG